MITRDEAVRTLCDVADSGILRDDIVEKLEEIAGLILDEKRGLHGWGADENYRELMVAWREDIWTSEKAGRVLSIWDKYAFEPSEFEYKETEWSYA